MTEDHWRDYDRRVGRLSDDQRELLAILLADAGTGQLPQVATPRQVAPRTATETVLAQIWTACLEVPLVGIDDDYFQLGGDSITAIAIVARATAAGLGVNTHDLFELRTVRRVAEAAEESPLADPAGAASQGVQVDEHAEYPLTPMQQGMLFHTLSDPGGTAYLAQVACRLEGPLDPAGCADACQRLVDRHSVLRTAFRWDGPEPRQSVSSHARVPVELRDWRGLPAAERTAAVDAYLAQDRSRRFDLGSAPLLRIALLRLEQATWVFVFTHHHLVLDGWSQQILLGELLAALRQPTRTTAVSEAADGLEFVRYVDWLTARDQGAAERYWRQRLADHTPTLLATSLSPGAQPRPHTVDLVVAEPTASSLTDFARGHGITMSSVLYGGWALLLAARCRSTDVSFGVTLAGRPPELPGATQALGNFITSLPLRVSVPADASVGPWLACLQRDRSELVDLLHTPLSWLSRLGSTAGGALFDSIAVIENFPLLLPPASEGDGAAADPLGVTIWDVRSTIDEGYPVVFEAHLGPPIVLRIRADTARLPVSGAVLLAALSAYLDLVATPTADLRLAELLTSMCSAATAHQRAHDAATLTRARRSPAGATDDHP
jgi:Condensation domain/Phosphopantetheine attachment site